MQKVSVHLQKAQLIVQCQTYLLETDLVWCRCAEKVSSMPGLFSFMQHPRLRQSSSSSSPQPPRAQTAENQAGPAQIAPAQGKLLPPRA